MPLLIAFASSLHNTRSPATSCTPSTTRRPPAEGLSGGPVEATGRGGDEREVSMVLPAMELVAILRCQFFDLHKAIRDAAHLLSAGGAIEGERVDGGATHASLECGRGKRRRQNHMTDTLHDLTVRGALILRSCRQGIRRTVLKQRH